MTIQVRLFRYRKYRIPVYRNQNTGANTGISAVFDVFLRGQIELLNINKIKFSQKVYVTRTIVLYCALNHKINSNKIPIFALCYQLMTL